MFKKSVPKLPDSLWNWMSDYQMATCCNIYPDSGGKYSLQWWDFYAHHWKPSYRFLWPKRLVQDPTRTSRTGIKTDPSPWPFCPLKTVGASTQWSHSPISIQTRLIDGACLLPFSVSAQKVSAGWGGGRQGWTVCVYISLFSLHFWLHLTMCYLFIEEFISFAGCQEWHQHLLKPKVSHSPL